MRELKIIPDLSGALTPPYMINSGYGRISAHNQLMPRLQTNKCEIDKIAATRRRDFQDALLNWRRGSGGVSEKMAAVFDVITFT